MRPPETRVKPPAPRWHSPLDTRAGEVEFDGERRSASVQGNTRLAGSILTLQGDPDALDGHVNSVVYYSYFDMVVNEYLVSSGVLDIEGSQ